MTVAEQGRLDALLAIADEEDSPLRERDIEFLQSLDHRRDRDLSDKQADWFDNLVSRHLCEED